MKIITFYTLFIMLPLFAFSQNTGNGLLISGSYDVGYADSILFDTSSTYNQYGYDGYVPIFTQIWFPIKKNNAEKDLLTLGELKPKSLPQNLQAVYEKLQTKINEVIIRDALTYDLQNDEEIKYANYTHSEVLDLLLQLKTNATRCSLPKKMKYPVIVYHHGSQGWSAENHLMAEYFASFGFIFIAANFHLPYENTTFGLLPYHLEKENKRNQSSAKAIISFAKTMTKNNHLFYMGHSWGAQEGWCFLNETNQVSAFISLETTIEYKSDTTIIKDRWPHLYHDLKIKNEKLNVPVLSCASVDEGINFDFFKDVCLNKTYFASYQKPFAHNSYTSIYLLRYFLKGQINLPDEDVLLEQWDGYRIHVQLIHDFIESVIENKDVQKSDYENEFKFY